MKKFTLLTLALIASFCFGFAVKAITTTHTTNQQALKRVTGIGGIFFKCQDPKKLREWYQAHLGLETNPYGSVFEWHQGAESTKLGFTQWSCFKETTTYFAPSTKDFMINYRVDNLVALVEELKKEGVTVTDTIESFDYGKFIHIMDIEGNKLELWEPNDLEYAKLGIQMGMQPTI